VATAGRDDRPVRALRHASRRVLGTTSAARAPDRIALDELRRLRELTLAINQLEREIGALVAQLAPELLAEPGFGPLIAAKLVGEIAGAQRFATPATLARAAGVAPIPPARATPVANGSTRAATARSTRPCTA
jgi:transposase